MKLVRCLLLVAFLLSLFCEYSIISYAEEPKASPEKVGLVNLGFHVLKTGDAFQIESFLMNEARYRQLREKFRESEEGDSDDGPSDKEIRALTAEAKISLEESLGKIRDILAELKFDLEKARLEATVVQAPREPGEDETKWIEYSADDPRIQLDIRYIIESEGNVAVIKLNDTFLVDGERYLARGFYFRSYKPSKNADESTKRIIREYQLDGGGWVEEILKRSGAKLPAEQLP